MRTQKALRTQMSQKFLRTQSTQKTKTLVFIQTNLFLNPIFERVCGDRSFLQKFIDADCTRVRHFIHPSLHQWKSAADIAVATEVWCIGVETGRIYCVIYGCSSPLSQCSSPLSLSKTIIFVVVFCIRGRGSWKSSYTDEDTTGQKEQQS